MPAARASWVIRTIDVLDVARGDHHQVGELVDDHQQVGVRREHALAARRRL